MYKVSVEIHTDGDFSCVDHNYDSEMVSTLFIVDNFKIAIGTLKDYLMSITSSLSGRSYVVAEVKTALDFCVKALVHNENCSADGVFINHEDEELHIGFDLGNQDISISILKIDQIKEDGFVKIVEVSG